MKNLYKIFLPTLIFAGLFFSCDDELNQLPYDEFATENAYVTAQDFENGLRGVYSALTSGGLYGSSDAGSLLSAPDILDIKKEENDTGIQQAS